MYTSVDDDDDEDEEEESLEECSTSTSCIPPLKTSSTKQKSDNIATAASDQANSVAPSSELGGTGFGCDQHQLASSNFRVASHKPIEVSTAPSTSLLCTNNSKSQVIKGRRKKGSEVEQFDFELDKMTKRDKKNVLELIKRVRRQEDELTRQQAYRDSFEEELKKLKESNDVLSRKCKEDITKAYACATNSLLCAASLEKENHALKDQLEEITCKFVKLQGTHIEL
jgi:acetylglutamate synthase